MALPWGRGVGKSWFLRVECYLLVAAWDGRLRPSVLVPGKGLSTPKRPGIRIVILMPTLAQFRKVHLAEMLAELEGSGEWAFLGGKINKSTLRIDFPGGSWIQVVSAEAAQGSRGIRCDVIVPDEADDIDPEIVEAVSQPWFTEPHSLRMTILGGTPKRGRYGLLWRAHAEWPAHAKLAATHHTVHATCYDAPRQVDRSYIDDVVRPKTSVAVFRREYLSDFDSAEGLVYPLFTPTFHVCAPDYGVPWTEVLVGIDHGWSDAGVLLVAGVLGQGRDAVIHVLEEVYETERETSWWCAQACAIAGRYRAFKQRWYGDPSRPDRLADFRSAIRAAHPTLGAGVSIYEAQNEIEAGVDAVADRIAVRKREDASGRESEYARLYVAPGCKNTIREFGLYRRKRDPRNQERVLDDIQDRDNHAMDALRYLTFTRFGGPDRRRHELPPYGRGAAA